jgi:ferredoxin
MPSDDGIGVDLVIANNPAFQALFSGGAGGSGGQAGGAGAAVENYAVAKVWIEPGCIVCNACEDIYPEVFDVQADTCIVRPNPPLTDGLRIQEAAEGCPVEVIKFTKITA